MIVPSTTDRNWRVSTYSAENNQCVEVALDTPAVGLRDSKAPSAGELDVPRTSWVALLEQIR